MVTANTDVQEVRNRNAEIVLVLIPILVRTTSWTIEKNFKQTADQIVI